MELRQLNYMMVIAEEGNYTRAAERLFVSQPALTQQIQKLENELGVQLFDRSRRQIKLTEAGKIVYATAQKLLLDLDEMQLALDDLSQLHRGVVRVGVVQTVNAYLMPMVVAEFKAAYPDIQLCIDELSMDEIETGLENGTLHFGLGFPPVISEQIELTPLFTEKLMLITSKSNHFAPRSSMSINAISGELVMLPRSFCTRRLWDEYANQANLTPNISIEMNTIHNILQTLQHNDNLMTILPELALANSVEYQSLIGIQLTNPTPQRTVSVLWRRNGYRSAAARKLVDVIYQVSESKLKTIDLAV